MGLSYATQIKCKQNNFSDLCETAKYAWEKKKNSACFKHRAAKHKKVQH